MKKTLFRRFSSKIQQKTGNNFYDKTVLSSYKMELNDPTFLANKQATEPILKEFE